MELRVGPARVLMYHAFGREARLDDPLKLTVTVDSLEQQIAHLQGHGWLPMALQQYVSGQAWRGRHRSVVMTIDDGYRSVAELGAEPMLRAGINPVLFVAPKLLGRPGVQAAVPAEELLTPTEVRALRTDGFVIGVHGLDHSELVGMSDAELRVHTSDARSEVADVCGVLPTSFAYPVGSFDDRALAAVSAAGFDVGFAVHRDAGRFAISRVDVNATDTIASFRIKLLPWYRTAWRALDRASGVRRVVRYVAGADR